jgi:hypothetical protein
MGWGRVPEREKERGRGVKEGAWLGVGWWWTCMCARVCGAVARQKGERRAGWLGGERRAEVRARWGEGRAARGRERVERGCACVNAASASSTRTKTRGCVWGLGIRTSN